MANLKISSGLTINNNLYSYFLPGDIVTTISSTTPSGWLECDGSEYNQSDYPDLYAKIGNIYNTIEGISYSNTSGKFRVPSLNNMSDSYFPLITGFSHTLSGYYGGNISHTHTQTLTTPQINSITTGNPNTSINSQSNASGHEHNLTQPSVPNDTINHTHNNSFSLNSNIANNFGNYQVTSTGAVSPESHTHNGSASTSHSASGYTHTHTLANTPNTNGYNVAIENHTHSGATASVTINSNKATIPYYTVKYLIKV